MQAATDIEIYIANLTTEQAIEWLKPYFSQLIPTPKVKGMPKGACPIEVVYADEKIRGIIFEKASQHFTSIWFDSTSLPWQDDRNFGHVAAAELNREVRITEGGWQANDDPDAWIAIQPNGTETAIRWKG